VRLLNVFIIVHKCWCQYVRQWKENLCAPQLWNLWNVTVMNFRRTILCTPNRFERLSIYLVVGLLESVPLTKLLLLVSHWCTYLINQSSSVATVLVVLHLKWHWFIQSRAWDLRDFFTGRMIFWDWIDKTLEVRRVSTSGNWRHCSQ
jgi:hypothetical protein